MPKAKQNFAKVFRARGADWLALAKRYRAQGADNALVVEAMRGYHRNVKLAEGLERKDGHGADWGRA